MANQLQRQIQEEIDREAKIDRLIENKVKKFLKQNKQFKLVNERKDCDAILYFYRDSIIKINFCVDNKEESLPFNDRFSYFFIKNKNTHHTKQHSYAFRRDCVDLKNIYS